MIESEEMKKTWKEGASEEEVKMEMREKADSEMNDLRDAAALF